MLVDKVSDYRTQFSKWWISEYKNVQFPEKVSLLLHVVLKVVIFSMENDQATLLSAAFCCAACSTCCSAT